MRLLSKLKLPLVIALLVITSGVAWQHMASAAGTGTVYLSPATASVQNGNNVAVALRITPNTTVDGVQATVNFDTTKLKYISIDSSASPFSAQLQQTVSGGTITIARGALSGGVSADSIVANITFQALVGSGSSSITLTNANATSGGAYTNPSSSGATINLTTPASTPPPSTGGGGSGGSGSGGSSGSSSGGSSSSGSKSSGSTTTPPPAAAPVTPPTPPTITPAPTQVQYSEAIIPLTTNTPTQAFIKYGTSPDSLVLSTPVSAFATTHQLTLDPSLLVPGTTYYYEIVATSQAGGVSNSAVSTIKTKGLTVRIIVTDKHYQPLRNAEVTLHSTAVTVKTDSNGVANFTNVAPGSHQLAYGSGKNQVTEPLTVSNTVTTTGTTQTATAQNVAVVMNVTAPKSPVVPVIIGLLIVLVVVAVFRFRRQLTSLPSHAVPQSPAATSPVDVINAPISQPGSTFIPGQPDNSAGSPPANGSDNQLDHIAGAATPVPGSTIGPKSPNDTEEK